MALTYTYADAYLGRSVTEERETRAIADIEAIATFSATWKEKLVVLRAYIITCLECQAQPDDLYAAKLKNYRVDYDTVLGQARANTDDADGNPLPSLTVELERA